MQGKKEMETIFKSLNLKAIALGLCLALPNVTLAQSASEGDYDDSGTYSDASVYDPYEDVNRAIYGFNKALDEYVLIPVVKGYRFVVPEKGREGIGNVLDNIQSPVTFLNALLQGDFEHAASTFWRFTVNSTLGGAGIMDVASAAGMKEREEDFGQTLGVYGVEPGAYIMLPFLGPSSVRDAGGRVVDAFSNPFIYAVDEDAIIGYNVVNVIDGRDATLDLTMEIERTSLDPYAALRSLYLQNREDRVRNGTPKSPPLN